MSFRFYFFRLPRTNSQLPLSVSIRVSGLASTAFNTRKSMVEIDLNASLTHVVLGETFFTESLSNAVESIEDNESNDLD